MVPKKDPQYTIPTTLGLDLEGLSPLSFLMGPHVYPLCLSGILTNSYDIVL
jgi:hypothetical protein